MTADTRTFPVDLSSQTTFVLVPRSYRESYLVFLPVLFELRSKWWGLHTLLRIINRWSYHRKRARTVKTGQAGI